MSKIKSNSSFDYFLLLVNPFLAAVGGFLTIRNRKSLFVIFSWFLVFGMGLSDLNDLADSYRYIQDFRLACTMDYHQYISMVKEFFTYDTEIKDLYVISTNFIVSRFTDNYHYLFLLYAFVFGFFYIKSLELLLRYPIKNDWVFYSLLFIFCFSNPIFNINGVRFWTAAWVCVYSTLSFILDNKYWKLLLLLIAPLIHISSIIWVLLIIIFLLTRKVQEVWVVLFIISSFISAVSYLDILSDNTNNLPPIIQAMIQSYTESDRAQEIMEGGQSPLYATILLNLPGYFRLILSYLLIFNLRSITKEKVSSNLFSAYLIVGSFVNFTASIPSVGVRFEKLTIPLLVILWAMNYKSLSKHNNLFYFVPVVYAYSILYWVRHMASITEIDLYIAPLPYTIFKYLLLA
jgi:hypothetical protein